MSNEEVIGKICKICGSKFNSTQGLASHLRKSHGMGKNEYYEAYINPDEDIHCPVCGKERKIIGWWRAKTCGDPKCVQEMNIRTNKSKWDNPEYRSSQISKYREFWDSNEGRELARNHALRRFIDHPDSAYSGVNAMRKSMYVDSKEDPKKFRAYRTKIRNTYLTQVGKDTLVTLYLSEFPDGNVKVGISKHIDKRFYHYEKVNVIKKLEMTAEKASLYELELLVKYHKFLYDRGEGKTLSEYMSPECKESLTKDFDDIKNGKFVV